VSVARICPKLENADVVGDMSKFGKCCAGFSDAGMTGVPLARAGVGEAPGHEVAGFRAQVVQRALWGFGAGKGVDLGRDAAPQ